MTTPPWENRIRYPGDDTFGPPKYRPVRSMEETFFYYFGLGEGNKIRSLVYHAENTPVLPDHGTFERWIADAKAGGHGARFRNADDVEWHKPAFLAFVVDILGWRYLAHPVTGENRALYFAEMPEQRPKPKRHGNRTFFNARTEQLAIGGERHELLVVENHHLKASGNGHGMYAHRKLNDEVDEYEFDIYLEVAIENGGDSKQWIILDPGGKNIGPP